MPRFAFRSASQTLVLAPPSPRSSPTARSVDAGDRVPVLDAIRALAFVGDLSRASRSTIRLARPGWPPASPKPPGARLAERCRHQRSDRCGIVRRAAALVGLHRPTRRSLDPARRRRRRPRCDAHHRVGRRGRGLRGRRRRDGAHSLRGRRRDRPHAGPARRRRTRAGRHVFENWNGQGAPAGLRGDEVPQAVYHVALAGDLEIFSRAHGLPAALRQIAERADAKYPRALVAHVIAQASTWLAALDDGAHERDAPRAAMGETPLALVADVIDLKLPWMTGLSRRVAEAARDAGAALGLSTEEQARLHRAGLFARHRARVGAQCALERGTSSGRGRSRATRLMPYWTGRAARRLVALTEEAELAPRRRGGRWLGRFPGAWRGGGDSRCRRACWRPRPAGCTRGRHDRAIRRSISRRRVRRCAPRRRREARCRGGRELCGAGSTRARSLRRAREASRGWSRSRCPRARPRCWPASPSATATRKPRGSSASARAPCAASGERLPQAGLQPARGRDAQGDDAGPAGV
ncbi:hypothetical protein Ddc_24704 [Ditylenchus destructor]|nr:hypothetical protein Ddc_24704 [Ditylenchus destructor]